MIKFLKKISYHPLVIQTIRFFHLRPIFRKWYYRLARPSDGILRFQISGINVQFYVSKPEELRLLEASREGEKEVLEYLVSYLDLGDVVYDIGANIGFFTIVLAKLVGDGGQVIAFEPEKESYECLQENLKLNNLSNVYVFKKALGEELEEGKLYLGKTVGNFSLVRVQGQEIGCQKVEIVRGDQFIKEQGLSIPRVVKIDVEGFEYSVLQGLNQTFSHPNCELICCEIHPRFLPPKTTEENILELIKSLGFRELNSFKKTDVYHLIAQKR